MHMKLLVAVSFLAVVCSTSRLAARAPNIILIMIDDMGPECINAYGGLSWHTPAIDRLASRGVRYTYAFSQPQCTPSRVQIMTGQYNVRNYTQFGFLEPGEVTFANLLRDAGYATCIAGKWQLGPESNAVGFGFDEYCLWQRPMVGPRYANPVLTINGEEWTFPGLYGPDVVNAYACDFIERHKDQPFLLYYPMILVHSPFQPTPASPEWDPFAPNVDEINDVRFFGDMVRAADQNVKRIMQQVNAVGRNRDTLIILTADNGTSGRISTETETGIVIGGKRSTTDAGTRTPFIVKWPGSILEGAVHRTLTDFTDVLPTIADAAGVPIPSGLPIDGRSLLPDLRGEFAAPRRFVYSWWEDNQGSEVHVFARNRRYKLYRTGEFFDVANDVRELFPLVNLTSRQAEVRANLQAVIDQYDEIELLR